ncbi:MAG: SseB family protein [Actinomycetota bacterium]|nr:SseB family protein [Actinomycetota bacterium]
MSEWEPATDAEVAMRDALRTDDQESYFRILSGVDLLLPVSADALAGLAPLGWGTWSTGGRTHVLAFTSTTALQSCLADYTGSARRVPYAELANTWPNLEWWLAVNPGLPIEGYLPAWFVAQLSRGDLRLPTRGPGRAESASTSGKMQDLQAAALAANAAAARKDAEPARPGGPTHDDAPMTAATGSYPRYPGTVASGYGQAPAAYGQAAANTYGGAYAHTPGEPPASELPSRTPEQPAARPGSPALPARTPAVEQAPATGLPTRTPAYGQPAEPTPARPPAYGQPAGQAPAYGQTADQTGGLPTRSPAATFGQAAGQAPGGGLPSREPAADYGRPAAAASAGAPPAVYGRPASAPPAYGQPASAPPAYGQPASAPAAYGQPAGTPTAYGQPTSPPSAYGQPAGAAPANGQPTSPAAAGHAPIGPGGLGEPTATPGFGQPAATPGAYGRPAAAPGGAAQPTPGSYGQPAATPGGYGQPSATPGGYGRPPADTGGLGRPSAPPASSDSPGAQPGQVGPGGLPVRTPSTVLPSGLPARAPTASAAPASAPPALGQSPASFGRPMSGPPSSGSARQASAPPAQTPVVPTAYQSPTVPPAQPPAVSGRPAPAGEDPRGPLPAPDSPLPVRTPMAQTPPVPDNFSPHNPDETPFNPSWSTSAPPATPSRSGPSALSELPRRQPSTSGGFPQGPASTQAASTQPSAFPPISAPPAPSNPAPGLSRAGAPGLPTEPNPGFGTPLPRRQASSSTEAPAGMTSFPAFQTKSDAAAQQSSPMTPPVIPGSPGSDRPARLGAQPPLDSRPASPAPQAPPRPEFVPANAVEQDLFDAANAHNTDSYLSTLLLATILVPVADHSRPGSSPGESGFAFRTEQVDDETFLVVFTSRDRLAEHFSEPTRTVGVRFVELIRNWPDPAWSFAVNPDGPIGAKYPGPQVIALANWAAESGLGNDADGPLEDVAPVPPPEPASDDKQHATVMQKTVPPDQVDYYLERGYDRVAGFVHRATEVEHLRTPAELLGALGLSYDASPHQQDAKEAYVLRWPAYRPSLYRIPYGGQNEQALRAMDGWVIERPPFRGNGFAPGEGRDVIAEFKVDSVRLPHGAQLWRIDADGNERMVAIFDNDGPLWRRVGEQ